jgi:MFS family permease
MKELFSLSGFVTLTGVFSIASMANQIVYTWLPLYLYEDFRMSLTTAGFSSTFYIQAASVTGILVGGWMADRWSLRNSRGRLFIQTVGLAVAGPFLFLTGFSSHPALLVLSLILFGFGRGFYDCNAMPVLAQIARVELWSTGYGVFNFAGGLTGGVITVVAGYLKASIGLGAMLQITAVLLSISAIMLLRIRIVSTALVEVPSTKGNKRS